MLCLQEILYVLRDVKRGGRHDRHGITQVGAVDLHGARFLVSHARIYPMTLPIVEPRVALIRNVAASGSNIRIVSLKRDRLPVSQSF